MSKKTSPVVGAKIKVIGVGGGGGNMIDHMISQGIGEIELIAANTDAQALDSSLADKKIQLGERKTRGLGAGMKPEVGKNAALESFEDLKRLWKVQISSSSQQVWVVEQVLVLHLS